MEVHHHPHHMTHKKKWKEYLLEFLMIFLAVFLGFFAENMRERSVENERAEEFAMGLINNLQSDTASQKLQIVMRKDIFNNADSLSDLLKLDLAEIDMNKAAKYFWGIHKRGVLASHRSTIKQLESSGALRYFKNKDIVNSLINYYNLLEQVDDRILYLFNYETQTIQPFQLNHFDMRHIDTVFRMQKKLPPFRNFGKEEQIQLYNISRTFGNLNFRLADSILPDAMRKANELIGMLKKEYHLKNE